MASTVTWRPSDDMAAWLEGRADRSMEPGGRSARTRVEMETWRAVLAAEAARQRWTLPELGLIADVCNGTLWPDGVWTPGRVAVEVIDARAGQEGTYGDRWGVDEQALVGRLTALGPAADIALADALARWWAGDHEHTIEGWAAVGVRVQ